MTSGHVSDPTPVAEDLRKYGAKLFRVVEAQHTISTNRLTDNPAEQEILESLIEQAKPTMPAEARGLHYLLGTAFRYGYWRGTRFRRSYERPGIFYASETIPTAIAETAFWRMRLFSASPGMKLPSGTIEHLAFSVPVKVTRALDLTAPPLVAGRPIWIDPENYEHCQRLATTARTLNTQVIRYESVRDPAHGINAAVLDPAAFEKPVPKGEQTWHFRFSKRTLTTLAALPSRERYEFTFEQFGLVVP